jgi:hypothetical protein
MDELMHAIALGKNVESTIQGLYEDHLHCKVIVNSLQVFFLVILPLKQ